MTQSDITTPSEKIRVSVMIPAKNEERNLPDCLASVKRADEIFVVDSGSTDRTEKIAEEYGAKVIQFKYNGEWPKKKNWALSNLPFKNDWVLIVDCDERIPDQLWQEIKEAIQNPDCTGYYIKRKVIFFGHWVRYGGRYPDWNMRLFQHKKGRYEKLVKSVPNTGDNEIHEHIVFPKDVEEFDESFESGGDQLEVEVKPNVGYLETDMLHKDNRDFYQWLERHNRYSNWEAQVYLNIIEDKKYTEKIFANLDKFFKKGPIKTRILKKIWVRWVPLKPIVRFIIFYIFKFGFLDGRVGLIYALLMSQYEYDIGVKLYELRSRQAKQAKELEGTSGNDGKELPPSEPEPNSDDGEERSLEAKHPPISESISQ